MNLSFVSMASGFGKRLGANKLYVPLKREPLYHHDLECLTEMAVRLKQKDRHQVRPVVASQYRKILGDGERLGLETVYNDTSDKGIATSLRLGTEVGGEDGGIFLFFVTSQLCMESATLTEFTHDFIKSGFDMGCVCSMGKKGNPAAFSRLYREELLSLREDKGDSVIVKRHPMDVWSVEVSENELEDIDVQTDLDREQEQPGKMQAGKRWNNE